MVSKGINRAAKATGVLTAILLWFVGGVIGASTGLKKK